MSVHSTSVEWAQDMLRDAQAAEITGTTTVLRLVWNRLEPALQRDVREPTAATTISQFMADLDLRYGQWYEMFTLWTFILLWKSKPITSGLGMAMIRSYVRWAGR
ncbi:hypothetical protein N7465_003285 [Penicillium sp. CMV-2018d]|nr:hypothetical protein N7465_003285 [Penicillium sp. CMV-2018d]